MQRKTYNLQVRLTRKPRGMPARAPAPEAERIRLLKEELASLSYSVSHDLRAPVRHIEGFAEMLLKNAAGELSAENLSLLRVLGDSARTLSRMMDGLMTFSRLGSAPLALARVDMEQAARRAARDFQAAGKEREITWSIRKLPRITADEELMRQVFFQLISNSVKFTRFTPKARIEIGSREREQEWVFHVSDNGAGFNPAYKHKLFGMFQRLHTAAEFEGIGIGLACARRIVMRHGGAIWAEGKENGGATISFSIPKKMREQEESHGAKD